MVGDNLLFLCSNDYPPFTRVLPPKCFEYAVAGRNILAGVAGNPARFIEQNVWGDEGCGACVAVGMVAALGRLFGGSQFVYCGDFRVRFYLRRLDRAWR